MAQRYLIIAALAALPAAESAADERLDRCARMEAADERLACYDEQAGRPSPRDPDSYLGRAWKLGPEQAAPRRVGDILSYRPNFVLSRSTDDPNLRPRSPTTGRSPLEDVNHNEIKIQGSFKTELVSRETFEHAGLRNARLWFGYTHNMAWQAFNHGESRPIRDTNYEPELILTLGSGNEANGFKLVNFGVSHQSNGIDPSQHRGWSRLYVQGGWEWNRLAVLARVWHIVPQSDDDNPNIDRYLGHGDVVLRYQGVQGRVTSVLLRANPAYSRGFVQVDSASRPLKALGGLKFHLQFTTGYGETLIDYNHRQTTFGLGVSFGDW
jgi:phospholipase A1